MAESVAKHGQKIKLFVLNDLLRKETDESNPLTTEEICKKLEEMGISCDRRILSNDIKLLKEHGVEIEETRRGHAKAYYIDDHRFSIPELKALIDSVHAASFITEPKADELVHKIAYLGGSNSGELLTRYQPCFNTKRHSNEAIYYIINECEVALQEKKRLSFYYFDLNEKKERVYRKNRKRYEVDPMALILNNNNYYLMCFSAKYDGITNYRLDRMEDATVINEPVNEGAIIHAADIPEFTRQAFSMYGGPVENAVLQFPDHLIGVVYDQFGEQTQIIRQDKNTCVATVQIQKSPTFWGWLFTFGNEMKILAPEGLIMDWKEQVRRLSQSIK